LHIQKILLIACTIALLSGLAVWCLYSPRPLKWLVCYATNLSASDFKKVDWALVDQDSDPNTWKNDHTRFIAYLSLGEANLTRSYLKKSAKAPYLIQANTNWPSAYWVDIRHPEWRKLILETVLPLIAARGFDGVFLDTLDVPIELERQDPTRYAGSKTALLHLIKEIKTRHPDWIIISNNALELLNELSPSLSAALAEDVYTRFDFTKNRAVLTPQNESREKVTVLKAFAKKTGKPALTLLYTDDLVPTDLAKVTKQATNDGLSWYATKNDLMTLGTLEAP